MLRRKPITQLAVRLILQPNGITQPKKSQMPVIRNSVLPVKHLDYVDPKTKSIVKPIIFKIVSDHVKQILGMECVITKSKSKIIIQGKLTYANPFKGTR